MHWKKGPGDFARSRVVRGVLAAGLIVVIGGIAAAADDARVISTILGSPRSR